MKTLLIIFLIAGTLIACKNKKEDNLSVVNACFSYSVEEDNNEYYILFSNCSENATSYKWDFGDGNKSTDKAPTHYYENDSIYIVKLTAFNELNFDITTDTILVNFSQVDKPNIYLYPEENINICIDLDFPQGGKVLKSIPDYNNEWCVNIDTSGKIDNVYNYLFYESIQPDVWQYEQGWCVKKESLKDFFQNNMEDYNFTPAEIKDFVDYWILRLTNYKYYNIYPQHINLIEKVIKINFSVEPDNLFRLFYVIVGTNKYEKLAEPKIVKIKRDGFTVVEWGVVIK